MTMPLLEVPALPVPGTVNGFYVNKGKRLLDLAFVLFALPIILPLLTIIVLLTLLEGGRPFYFQTRIGQDGRAYRFWKVRTMVRNADRALDDILSRDAGLAAEWALNQKLARDPRITRLGAVLRKTSLDELPQLWNVVNGSMSLVGPRPFLPEQQELYAGGRTDIAYYRVRPGLTGLWQISRRNAGSFAERVIFDTRYARQITLMGDLAIIFRTFSVVLKGTGI